ncbi:MAG: hypothetical protein ACOZF0_22920 [Thermodesulfobacteriota bacterium]
MTPNEKFVPVTLTLIAGIVLQILFVIPDKKDTPGRVAAEFARAYARMDAERMTALFCSSDESMADSDAIGEYVYRKTMDARERGYGLCYLKDRLYDIRTYRVGGDEKTADIRLTAAVKPPLKAFFTGEECRRLDEIITVVKEKGRWRVCGHPFSLGLGQ